MVGNNIRTHPPFFWHHLVSQNLKTLTFLLFFQYSVVIFSILGGGPKKVNDLLTSPSNQFRDYFIRNRLEKLVPLNYEIIQNSQKSLKKIDKPFSNLDFWPKSGFPKTRVSSPVAPRGVYISRNDPKKKIFFWKCQKTSKIVIF